MGILKRISISCFAIILLTGCRKNCNEFKSNLIVIQDCNDVSIPKEVQLITFKKGSNFKEVIQEKYDAVSVYKSQDEIKINIIDNSFFPFEISSKRDYRLILDNKLYFDISEMKPSLFIDNKHHTMGGAVQSCILKSLKVNDNKIINSEILIFSIKLGKVK